MTKAKLGLIGSIAVSLLAVSVASVSTLAWFQINSSAEVAQPTQTKNIQTNATVHQSNAHSNDDAYQTSPTSDMGGTLSYDHSKGGKATNYYIRQYGGASEITLQMYTNENNTDDKAVYYNIKFTNKWKIYEASTPEHYYGYDDIDPSDPLLGSCGVDGDRNITIGSLTGYYDVYLTSSNKIWIVDHSETTTSDEMGNETGYYIYGTAADGSSALSSHADIEHGIPMYVNAAAGASDLAYYAGLRLSDSDVFYLASGDTTNPYTSSESGGGNLLNNGSYFSFNTTTGAITCNQLGYYCIALTSGSNIHISAWDGMEVDGSTRYTVKDSGNNPLRQSHLIGPKRTPTFDNTKLNYIGIEDSGSGAYLWIHLWGGASGTEWPGICVNSGSASVAGTAYFVDASDYVGWTHCIVTRRSSNATSSSEYNRISTYDGGTLTANTKNYFKINGSCDGFASVERRSTIKEYRVLDGSAQGSAAGTGYCWNNDSYTPSIGATPTYSGYVFKGWYTNSACTSSWTSGTNVAHDRNLYAKFVSSKTVSFHGYKMDTSATVSDVVDSKNVETGSTFTFPAMPTPPTGYKLYDGKWHTSTSSGSTSYSAGTTSPTVNAPISYYVLYEKLASCTVKYYKSYDGVADAQIGSNQSAYQTASFTTRALPSGETGYSLVGWYTNPNGTGTKYNASSSVTCPSQSTLNLYACFTTKVYNYYLTGDLKGGFTSGSGSINQTATYSATSITWTGVTFTKNETWKLFRPSQDSPFTTNDWWGADLASSSGYYHNSDSDSGSNHNFVMNYGGTYNITLTLSPSTSISVTMTSPSTSDFKFYQYSGETGATFHNVSPNGVSGMVLTWNTSITMNAGYEWHIEGPAATEAWGINTGDNTNIKATTDWEYYFTQGSQRKGSVATVYNVKSYYDMTVTSITFDLSTNNIVFTGITLSSSQFKLETSSTTLSTGVLNGNNVTFTNVHLATDTPWHLHIGTSGIYYSYNALPPTVSILNQAGITKGTYFYEADDGSDWVGTGYGGTYTLVFNYTTRTFSSVTCSSLDDGDFIEVRKVGDTVETTNLTGGITNLTNHTVTYSGSVHLFFGDDVGLYFKNNNTGSKVGSVSCTHNYNFGNADLASNLGAYSSLFYNHEGRLTARVDVSIDYTFVFNASNTHGTFTITDCTENTNISFKHAEEAGIYIETATNSSFTTGVTKKMMHTTSGKDMNGNTYLAQEAPIYTASGTSYMRVIKTHSNGSGTTPNASTIRSLTEYYYVAQDASQSGFSSSTSTRSVTGNGDAAYVTVTTAGTWTVSLRTDGAIHIEPYSGASTESTEHEVPYYLIGRGMPGSNIRGCDYTTGKGIKLWTYGGNSSTVPCYVGTYGNNNTNPANYVGTGISLKKGDTFALSSASKLIKTFTSNSVTGVSINTTTGIVTVNTSGTYRIYLTGSVGSESINIAQVSDGSASDWSRSGDVISQNGVSLISSSGNTLTLGGNLDYSLLDAYGNGGYTFEIELDHVSSGAAGTMYYTITNSNGYSIDVAMKAGNYASNVAYSANTTIANGTTSSNLYNRSITASTTTSTTIRITLTPAQIRSMISSGSYSFSMTISYSFTESTIS